MSYPGDFIFRRPACGRLLKRLKGPRSFIQVIFGPRQVGKTVLAAQVAESLSFPSHYAAADEQGRQNSAWIHQQWEIARGKAEKAGRKGSLLVLDEVQKITDWSEAVKRLWDEDTAARVPVKVLILGSSPLLVQRGARESLTGRFEVFPLGHWTWPEMKEAFGWSLDKFVYFGGYPKAAQLVREWERWRKYLLESIVETTLSRDILFMTRVDKPALLRQLFEVCCDHSGQVVSYQKMLGILQGAGNTVTLAHYLHLLTGTGLATGLQKYAKRTMVRGSSPKVIVLNQGLVPAVTGLEYEFARKNPAVWGRLVETAVGAYLAGEAQHGNLGLFYWRERDLEVDFVLRKGDRIAAIEVKSGAKRESFPGMSAFQKRFNPSRCILVGPDGVPLEEFLSLPASHWLR